MAGEPQVAHDYAEVFDGVPSQHDGKDAAVVAELCHLGKCQPWPYAALPEAEQELRYWVERLDERRRLSQACCGRLEGKLARHWPEATRLLKVSGGTLLRVVSRYGGAAGLAGAADGAEQVRRMSRGRLTAEKAAEVVASAASSVGVRATAWEARRMKELALQAMEARRESGVARRRLAELGRGQGPVRAMSAVVGLPTACVLWACNGDPGSYRCANAFVKALGLNLAERSSGVFQGRVKLSKRGKAMSRRWLYFAAMRWVNDPRVRPWYERKKARDGSGMRALAGVMRKLAKALYHVGGKGEAFDAGRLFPGLSTMAGVGDVASVGKGASVDGRTS